MPTDQFLYPEYMQNRITMTPEKFGTLGSYCRSTLRAEPANDQLQAQMFDQTLVRFTMNVMSGRTVSESPEVTFTYWEFPTWRDHLKHALGAWRDKQNARWEGTGYDGKPDTPPPWMILLWPFLVLFLRWLKRHPVNQTPKVAKTTVDFRQSVLYPQMDHIPAEFGYPVIYETLEMSHPGLGTVTPSQRSRFLDEHEIVNEIYRDPEMFRGYPGGPGSEILGILQWLKRNGVNTDQLVKRKR